MNTAALENKRQTQINALKRHYEFVQSTRFDELKIHELKTRRSMVKRCYEDFTTEHANLSEKCNQKKFNELDSICEYVEGRYMETIARINERIDQVEKEIEQLNQDEVEISRASISAELEETVSDIEPSMSELNKGTRKIKIRNQERQDKMDEISDDEDVLIFNDEEAKESDNEPSSTENEEVSKQNASEEDLRQRLERFKRENDRYQRESREFLNQAMSTRQQEHLAINQLPGYRNELNRAGPPNQLIARRAPIRATPYTRPVNRFDTVDENVRNRLASTNKSEPPIKVLVCNNCAGSHSMAHCAKFIARTINQRRQRVQELKLCKNCFIPSYYVKGRHYCKSKRCKCGQFHNTLLCHQYAGR